MKFRTPPINISSFLMTKTVEGGINPEGPPNRWSIRPPANNWSQSSAPITEQILRSYNRGEGKWFDFAGIFNDNFSYGVHDNDSLHVEITNGTTWAVLNYTWVVETTAFRNMFFLTRSALEAEDKAGKKEYRVYADNPLLVKFWDIEHMRGTDNYTVCMFKNINYSGTPTADLKAYYCNSSYRTVPVELPNNGGSDATANMTGNVLLMHLDETSGTIVDYSGEGNNGTYNGALYDQPGKINFSIGFDKVDDMIDCGKDTSLDVTNNITIEAWVKPDTLTFWSEIVSKRVDNTTNYDLRFGGLGPAPYDRVQFYWGCDPNWQVYSTTNTFATGKWYHVAVTREGTNLPVIYVNGELEAGSCTYGNCLTALSANTNNVIIGGRYAKGNIVDEWDGEIDEVAIWNRTLNATEIKDLYTRAVLKPVDSPYCEYHDSFNTTDLDNIYYTTRNSSYSKECFAVNNSQFGGIDATDTFYVTIESGTDAGNCYTVRYANGSSGTNVSFADSKVAWSSANNAVNNWTQAEFTSDLWFSTIKNGDLFQLGVYVENTSGNGSYTNFTLHEDEIGAVNDPISKPSIAYYQSASGSKDYDLNGTYSGNMTIRVQMAKDPDAPGTVTHNLTLRYPDGSGYYTINGSFNSSDDSPVDIEFDTKNVLNGRYRMKVTAVADDNPSDVTSFLTPNNFTTDNPTYVNETHWWRCGATANASETPITAAVENATTGETIYVFNGSYDKESANVNKRLTLQGESVAGVNVNATALGEQVFNVTANYVNISGFNVSGATGSGKAGFYLNGVEHCDISGNNASGNYYGIYLNSAGNNTLMSNTAKTNTEYGIYLNSASNNTVKKNTVAKNKDGVYLTSAGSNNITCNWLYYNTRAGFNLTGGSIGNNISHNNIVENGALNDTIREWQFYNNQIDPVTATHNWWGSNENDTINDSIYNTKGNVTVFPRLYQPDPCAPIPELSTVILVGVGLVVLSGYVRIRRRRR